MLLCQPSQFTQWTRTRDGASLSQQIRTRSLYVWSKRLLEWIKRLQLTIRPHSSLPEAQLHRTTWRSMVVRSDQHKRSWMAQYCPLMSLTTMISVSPMAHRLRCRRICWLDKIAAKAAQWEKRVMETSAYKTIKPTISLITAQTRTCMIGVQWPVVINICHRISAFKCKWARIVKEQQ